MADSTAPFAHDPNAVGGVSMREIRRALRRDLCLILGITALFALAAGIISARVPRQYESEITLRVGRNDKRSDLLGSMAPVAGLSLGGLGDDDVDTDIGILQSREIVGAVVDSLALNVHLTSPRRPRAEVLRVLEGSETAPVGLYTLHREDNGDYTVTAEDVRGPARLPEHVTPGLPFQIGSLRLEVATQPEPPQEIRVEVTSAGKTLRELREDLDIRRQTGRSKLVDVRYRSSDPRLTPAVLDVLASNFIHFQTKTSKSEAQHTVDVLRGEVADYEQQLHTAEQRLADFSARNRVVSIDDEATAQVKRLAEMQTKRDALMVERKSLSTVLQRIAHGGGSPETYRQLASFPSFLTNAGVQNIIEALVELGNERAELSVRLTNKSADVAGVDRRIRELEQQLHDLGSNYLASLSDQLAATDSILQGFDDQLAAVPMRELEYARRARDAKLLTEVYATLQTRLREAEVQAAIDNGDSRLLDAPLIPEKPVSPKPWLNVSLAAVLGLLVGGTLVIGRELTGGVIRSPEDARAAVPGVALLGIIPRPGPERRRLRRVQVLSRPEKDGPHLPSPHRVTNPAVEALRTLYAQLVPAGARSEPRVVVVTGVDGAVGSAACAGDLATLAARQSARTLLLDADRERSALAPVLGTTRKEGLMEVLRGELSLQDSIQQLAEEGRGAAPNFLALGSPSDPGTDMLLLHQRLPELLAELRNAYDLVVINAAPLGRLADAAEIGALADLTVVVADLQRTQAVDLESGITLLRRWNVPGVGLLLVECAATAR